MIKPLLTLMLTLPIIGCTQLANVIKVKVQSPSLSDETVVRFLPGATSGFDSNFDAYKFFSINQNAPSIFTSISSGDNLSINALPLVSLGDTVVAVNSLLPINGNYSITLTELGYFDDSIQIIVHHPSGTFEYAGDTSFTLNLNAHFDTLNPLQLIQLEFQIRVSPANFSVVNASCPNSTDGEINIDGLQQGDEVTIHDASNTIIHHTSSYSQPITLSSLAVGEYSITTGSQPVQEVSVESDVEIYSEFEVNDTILYTSNPVVFTNSTVSGNVEYVWGDGATSNCTNCSHTYASAGIFIISQVVTIGACSTSSNVSIEVIDDNSVGVTEYSGNNLITISNGYIHAQTGSEIQVYDLSGKLVKRGGGWVSTNDMRGIYIVHSLSSGSNQILKVSLQ